MRAISVIKIFQSFPVIITAICLAIGAICPVYAEVYCYQNDGGVTYYTNVPGPGRTRVRIPLIREKSRHTRVNPALSGRCQEAYAPAIAFASRYFAVDPNVVRAVIKAESNYNARAVSNKGAMGLMQLMPGTAKEMGVDDPFNPEANIHGGVRYLSQLLGSLNGDLPLALAAYNAGPARVFTQNRIPPIPETQNYVTRVIRYYKEFNDYKVKK
jgi:soluble lytic murein transglycosylase-like protein